MPRSLVRLDQPAKQGASMGVKPGVGPERAVREARLSRQRQMLASMRVIDNLRAIGEIGIGQVPNPSGAIGSDAGPGGLLKVGSVR